MKSLRRSFVVLASSAAFTIAGTAAAETLPLAGIYAAEEDGPSRYRTIVVESADGNEGAKLALELRNAVSSARLDGHPYFDVRSAVGQGEGAPPVAWLSAAAFSEVERVAAGSKEETECVRKDDSGRCVKSRTSNYDCSELHVSFKADVILLDARDDIAYERAFSDNVTSGYCTDESSTPSAAAIIDGMIESFARQVRRDMAPTQQFEHVRVLESRDDMEETLRRPFKQALRLTKSDWTAACNEFDRLNALQPDHETLTFNAGLCREAQGDLDGAEALYRRTLELEPGKNYPTAGLYRIASRRRAEWQVAVHRSASSNVELADSDRRKRAKTSGSSGSSLD